MSRLYWAQRVLMGLEVVNMGDGQWQYRGLVAGGGLVAISGPEDANVARGRTGADRDIRLTWLGLADGLHADGHASGN